MSPKGVELYRKDRCGWRMGAYRHALIMLQPRDREAYQSFVWTSLLGQKETARFQIQYDSGTASSRQRQILYVEEEEVYLVANCCHVRHKGALEKELVNRKLGDHEVHDIPFIIGWKTFNIGSSPSGLGDDSRGVPCKL